MATFKDFAAADVDNVFFNLTEFADKHLVDGVEIVAMVDDMEHIEREKRMKSNMDGVFVRQILLYVKASDLSGLPSIGRIMTLDGKSYRVLDSTDEDGVYTITLEANRSVR